MSLSPSRAEGTPTSRSATRTKSTNAGVTAQFHEWPYTWYRSWVVMFCGWEGNLLSGLASHWPCVHSSHSQAFNIC